MSWFSESCVPTKNRVTVNDNWLSVQSVSGDTTLPNVDQFEIWVSAALKHIDMDVPRELCIRIVDEAESRLLNERYRGQDKATNVLSFAAEPALWPEGLAPLGDLAICAPIVAKEAAAQSKPLAAHWCHLCVHGVLHLAGFDHEATAEATEMEALETRILADLGFRDPYITLG